jgi:hypothetical protein
MTSSTMVTLSATIAALNQALSVAPQISNSDWKSPPQPT